MLTDIPFQINKTMYPLDGLIEKYGLTDYIRDYYAAVNGRLAMLYTEEDFYIAEDFTYEPWLSIMGGIDFSGKFTDDRLHELLDKHIENDKYIAVYTNLEQVAELLAEFPCFTYHENFLVASILECREVDDSDIRLAEITDLPFIENTYVRSGHEQLLNRIRERQLWIAEAESGIKGYAGVHKDGSLGFEYVAENFRGNHIATRLQHFVAGYMLRHAMMPYVMISEHNTAGKNLQHKLGSHFAKNLFYFFAKGPYVLE